MTKMASIDYTPDNEGHFVAYAVIMSIPLAKKTNLIHKRRAKNRQLIKCSFFSINLSCSRMIRIRAILLFLSDTVPYMIKTVKYLKLIYSMLEHNFWLKFLIKFQKKFANSILMSIISSRNNIS